MTKEKSIEELRWFAEQFFGALDSGKLKIETDYDEVVENVFRRGRAALKAASPFAALEAELARFGQFDWGRVLLQRRIDHLKEARALVAGSSI